MARFDPANDSLTRTTLDHVYTPSLAAGDDEVWLTRGDLEGPTGTILRLGNSPDRLHVCGEACLAYR